MSIDPNKILSAIPTALREPLIETYREIASNFSEHRWEPLELNGGKFCEVVYWIVHGFVTGSYAAKPSKPPNMRDACRTLENLTSSGKPGDHGLRILVARMLPPLYDIRNNRGVGHVGGDVDPNLMDSTAVYSIASWILAELIRVFHQVSTREAQDIVDALVERKIGLIWSPGTTKRVLDTTLSTSDQTLLILHQSVAWVTESDLVDSTEYSSASMFRARVLEKLHKSRHIEYDRKNSRARISPKGSDYVESAIIAPRTGWSRAGK